MQRRRQQVAKPTGGSQKAPSDTLKQYPPQDDPNICVRGVRPQPHPQAHPQSEIVYESLGLLW